MNTSSLLPPPTISITLPVRIILFQHLVEPVSDSLPLTILVSTVPGHLWNLKLLGQSQQIKELIMRHTTNVTDTEPRKISITGKGYNQNMMVFVVFPQSINFLQPDVMWCILNWNVLFSQESHALSPEPMRLGHSTEERKGEFTTSPFVSLERGGKLHVI